MPSPRRLSNRSVLTRSVRALLISAALPAALAAQTAAPTSAHVPASPVAVPPSPLATGALPAAAAETPPVTSPASVAPARAPLAAAQPIALRARRTTPATLPTAPQDTNRGNTALVIVGAAAIVVGAIVGDDAGTVIMVGGAGIGLFGLWRLLN